MSTSAADRDAQLNRLAEEFADRYRRGERPALSEYTDRHPELAEEIRELFPALVEIERVEEARREPVGPPHEVRTSLPRQLGDYLVLREIGRGGMGVVYEAVQQSLGRHVALKILPWQAIDASSQLERFRLEARAAAKLHHTNIVPVFGVGEQDGMSYYAMQLIRGQGLDDVIAELRRLRAGPSSPPRAEARPAPPSDGAFASPTIAASVARALLTGRIASDPPGGDAGAVATAASLTASFGGPTTEHPGPGTGADPSPPGDRSELTSPSERPYYRQVARVGLQVAEGLAYAHAQGILHRDIKPSNLLMDTRGTVWITDFGLAKAEGSDGPTHTGDIVGTLRYMAPERFDGRSDPRSDVYALGATLYELLTLRPVFGEVNRGKLLERLLHEPPEPPRKRDRQVPRDLETVVLKALAKEPGRRYADAAAMAADLRRVIEDQPIRARRVGPLERTWRWCRRNPAMAGLGAAVALLLFAVVSGLTYGYRASLLALETETELHAEADRQAEEARAVTAFLTGLLDRATEPGYAVGRAVTVEDLMAKAEEMLAEGPFGDRPLVEADLRFTIGKIYLRLKLDAAAVPHLRRAWEIRAEQLGPSHQDTLLSQVEYAWALDGMGRYDESQRQIERCWQLTRRRFGPDHPKTRRVVQSFLQLSLFHGSGDRREHQALLEDALRAISRSSLEDKETEAWESEFLKLKQIFLELEGRLAQARQLVEELRSRPGRETGTEFDASIDLANLEFALGEWGKAQSRMQQVLEVSEPLYSGMHWTVWMPRMLLVRVAQERGALGRAQGLLEAGSVSTGLGKSSREIALAENAALRGDLDRARALRDQWSMLSHQAGRAEEEYLKSLVAGELVWYYPQLVVAARVDVLCGNLARARGLCDRLLEYGLPVPWIRPHFGLWKMNDLSRTLATAPGTRDQPEDVARALAMAEMIVAAQPEIGFFKTTLGIARYRRGGLAGAIDALTTAERLRRDENTAATHGFYLAMAHHRLGRPDEARSWFDRAADWMDAHRSGDPGLISLRAEAEALLRPASLDAAFPADPFAP